MPKHPGGVSADRQTDPGPDGLRQGRLRGAGWVRNVENETPTFDLPPQHRRTWDRCDVCGRWGLIVATERNGRRFEDVCKACHDGQGEREDTTP